MCPWIQFLKVIEASLRVYMACVVFYLIIMCKKHGVGMHLFSNAGIIEDLYEC